MPAGPISKSSSSGSGSQVQIQKRSWDGGANGDGFPLKRTREGDPRDWKDVYMNGNGDSRGGRRDGDRDRERDRDRYQRDKEKERNAHRPDSRRGGPKHHDRERERYRDHRERGGRDSGRPSRRHSRDRDEGRSRRSSRPRSRSQSKHVRDPKMVGNGHESEREEGEISPPATRTPTPTPAPPSSATLSTRPRTPPPLQPPPKPETQAEMELDLEPETTSKPVEETLAERRARRQAIRAKYAGIDSAAMSVVSGRASQSPGPSSAVLQPPPTSLEANLASKDHSIDTTVPRPTDEKTMDTVDVDASGKASPQAMSPSIEAFALAKEEERQESASQPADEAGEQILAADYDPSLDRREDEEKRVRAVAVKDGKHQDVEMLEVEDEEEEEEVDDMFALDALEKKTKKVKKVAKPAAPALITTTLDTASDVEGYYNIILGEQLDGGKYQVFSSLGKGMFANVVRARVLESDANEVGKEVAIKIVRSQESMYKAGLKEVQILNKLRQADPEDKKHIVRLERTFEHRGHLCLVFESLSMNLREVVKRFGKDVGLNIRAVRAYAHQLFLAMSLLRKCNIMHADIKPDNILANEQKTVLKVCDLGSASDISENEITPYLVSRFYRAPEIILGVPYDCALDIWSIGCTLYELYTGKILFPGRTNNQMLLLMMEVKGRFNSKMIKKAKFGENYFDEMGAFQSVERDKVTGADVIRKVHVAKPTRDLRSRLMPSSKVGDEEAKLLMSFIDLLEKCLMPDPSRRITPKEALTHPFIRG